MELPGFVRHSFGTGLQGKENRLIKGRGNGPRLLVGGGEDKFHCRGACVPGWRESVAIFYNHGICIIRILLGFYLTKFGVR